MTFITPTEAEQLFCPLSSDQEFQCCADRCPVWRWRKYTIDDPAFKDALKAECNRLADEKGSKSPGGFHKTAAKNITDDPAKYGLNFTPTHGWCGLGGKPEV